MSRVRRIGGAAVVSVLLVALAACTGQPRGQVDASSCASPGVTDSEVRVGVVYTDSGALSAPFAPARAGFEARLAVENEKGGVNGRRIVYQPRDDGGSTAGNLAVSRDLVANYGAFAILQSSATTSGAAKYLADEKIPVIGISAEEVWSSYRNMFAFAYLASKGLPVDTFGRFVKEHGGTRAMVIGTSTRLTGSDLNSHMVKSLRGTGVQIDEANPVVEFLPGVTSAARLAQRMVDQKIDTVVSGGAAADIAEVVSAARNAGVRLKVVLTATAPDAALLEQYGQVLAGLVFFEPFTPFESENPGLDAYHKAMARHAPEISDPNQTVALAAYINADMLIRGLQEAGPCPTRQGFIDRLRQVHDYTAGGLVPTTDFEADFGQLRACYAFVRVAADAKHFEVIDPNYCGTRLSG
ncbi:ABC-type branched-chain amino acid transport system, substrate-binding protein [Parafrankia irregularis]|uniref:ABC-type branched-chain amino acid transport system, substrate-binding protein n=1 Tax=Parafrankia irregularis TaxID=795642 RepID=A0A0S4QYH7_9ACTN|nr:ABC transporter substrate-binding protein [Parafrankia sp. CH37]CUU60547.1 ABC-type branched-chain amino acid transport system, substrate-binding protein [Parafrankia irregularis]